MIQEKKRGLSESQFSHFSSPGTSFTWGRLEGASPSQDVFQLLRGTVLYLEFWLKIGWTIITKQFISDSTSIHLYAGDIISSDMDPVGGLQY